MQREEAGKEAVIRKGAANLERCWLNGNDKSQHLLLPTVCQALEALYIVTCLIHTTTYERDIVIVFQRFKITNEGK